MHYPQYAFPMHVDGQWIIHPHLFCGNIGHRIVGYLHTVVGLSSSKAGIEHEGMKHLTVEDVVWRPGRSSPRRRDTIGQRTEKLFANELIDMCKVYIIPPGKNRRRRHDLSTTVILQSEPTGSLHLQLHR